jgi:hypothetical protein
MKSQIYSTVIEVAIVTVTNLLTALLTKPVIKRMTEPGITLVTELLTKPVITLVIKRVTTLVTELVTKPVNGIYEFGAFEADRFR